MRQERNLPWLYVPEGNPSLMLESIFALLLSSIKMAQAVNQYEDLCLNQGETISTIQQD